MTFPPPLAPLSALEHPVLDWSDQAAPHSRHFGDVYFSRQSGQAETEHVFLKGNDLPGRFVAWQEPRPFVIGETGFGTGLNMLCAVACFQAHAPPGARLHLVSTERFPLQRDDLARALSAWPVLTHLARPLIDQWPLPVGGVHRLWLDERVILDLHFGDSVERLARLDGKVDAWFLDGFAPAKNPEMWQLALLKAMAAASRPGATFSTFTCAGVVKRGLSAAGFAWRKAPGFGRKREMLRGEIERPPQDDFRHDTPWFVPPPARRARHVAVIGAGVAGASVAHALARRGISVTLLDRTAPGAGASGNDQGALYVKLAAQTNLQSRFYLAGLQHSRRWLAQLDPENRLWRDCGVLQLATNDREARRQARFLANHPLPASLVEGVDAATASARSGIRLEHGGLDYPNAGWVRPRAICQRLAAAPGIMFRQGTVEHLVSSDRGWQLVLANGERLEADHVVIANAAQASRFAQSEALPLRVVRGQITQIELDGKATPELKRVVCAGGYVPPPLDGRLIVGASFRPNDSGQELRDEEHAANLAELAKTLPAYFEALQQADVELDPTRLQGRVALRAASPDKTPYAGPVPVAKRWHEDYAMLAKDARRIPATPGAHHPGLWISTAHGSRGFASAPLCAEIIASRLCDEPPPLERELVDHLHPGRRLIRELITSQ
ncbi:bifunctional tRNA (5-methylaminomethyl-2-thiouridine)(34)-methyltransferase MnmD/FAD-dependent 5-carboxymethylaminomethyl-2-thiouridine(34) oxidoreductase MnmC [Pistricoccus aurantiacus]|uniref:bifunctional tRNA (5-methylaminomethyl-2-thiouridine)(34)-methyltransferase MnmD/FAD-dependent 5-carboxymethylaminomethyl-2-thiouridine(34) oxidoreductase MnmC n=1 Tax=Pistricoccus aurantiacus TaxID=1883414 RepID=UPI00362DEAA0